MDPVYICLVILRILLVFGPQYGYIHPDEFFQTTEVLTGDIFDIDVDKPWEFTTFPIRSVSLIYIMYGLPLKLLKMTGQVYPAVRSGYWILVIPRLISALLSLVIDCALYRLCKCFDVNAKLGLRLMASSYVMFTYMTRTFTNFIEAFLFAILLLLVFSDKTVELYVATDFGDDDGENMENLERTSMKNYLSKKIKRSVLSIMYKKSLDKSYFLKAFLIGIIGVAALFNRPTFVLMALCPALLYCDAKQEKTTLHAVFVGAGAMCSFIIFTVIDTLYFAQNFQELFKTCDIEKSSLSMCYLTTFLRWIVVTPYNFFIYNSNPYNLAEHGLHPRYLHFTVNLILLFGPLSFLVYKKLFHLLVSVIRKEKFHKSYFPLVMTIIPLTLLSGFPHQEPRFLIPVLPLVVMSGTEQMEEKPKLKKLLISVWIFFNFIMTPVYGCLHQGGVVQSLLHVEKQLNFERLGTNSLFDANDKFVFFRTYMPPHSLLLSKKAKLQITDMKGGTVDYFLRYLPERLSKDEDYQKNKESGSFFVITPSTVVTEFQEKGVNFTTVFVYFGHLSTEDPPNVAAIYSNSKKHSNIIERVKEFSYKLSNALTLHMIKMPYDQLYLT